MVCAAKSSIWRRCACEMLVHSERRALLGTASHVSVGIRAIRLGRMNTWVVNVQLRLLHHLNLFCWKHSMPPPFEFLMVVWRSSCCRPRARRIASTGRGICCRLSQCAVRRWYWANDGRLMAVGHNVRSIEMRYFCDSSFSGDIPMVVEKPYFDVLCHLSCLRTVFLFASQGLRWAPNQISALRTSWGDHQSAAISSRV